MKILLLAFTGFFIGLYGVNANVSVAKSRVGFENATGCGVGYMGTPPNCFDVDECLIDNGGCSDSCHNSDGSYYCLCYDERIFSSDMKNCLAKRKSLRKRSDKSMDFYLSIPENYYGNIISTGYYLYITTLSSESIDYTVKKSTGTIKTGTVSSTNSTGQISLDLSLVVRTPAYTYRNLGLHVHTSGPASVLVVNFASHAIGEYPAIPYHSLNISEYVFYAVSTGSLASGSYPQILLVGNENSTSVTVTPTKEVTVPVDPQTDSGTTTLNAGSSKTLTLNKFQTILITATLYSNDLSGSKITSNKPLSVITGHECGNIPKDVTYCEGILEQIPPTAIWGKQFLLSPYKERAAQYYKILASKSSTTVKHNCNTDNTFTLTSAGSYVDIETAADKFCYLEANEPILVTQMSPGYGKDSLTGDPAISVIPPMEKYIKAVSFFAPDLQDIPSAYVNIVTKNISVFHLDNTGLNLSWNTITNTDNIKVGYSAQITSVSTDASHNISSSTDVEFYVLVYGFAYGKAFSFTPSLILTSGVECADGYQLGDDKVTCEDINECVTNEDDCDDPESCVNTVGSYHCGCSTGYSLNDNNQCVDIDECMKNNDNCEHSCTNTNGSYECSCDTGYKIVDDIHCTNEDECNSNNGGCQHKCIDTDGSYICTCEDGYELNSDGKSCSDVNECDSDDGGCSDNCHNTPGSYKCSCNDGYHLTDAHLCVDTNECGYVNCPQKCVNTAGSYKCECLTGYTGSNCDDINECASDNGGCDDTCTNTDGSFYCTCDNGYELHSDKMTCEDTNECELNNGGCEHSCSNSDGSYECTCNSGYELEIDKKGCKPVCSTDCSNHCSECVSPSTCSCDPGWTGSDCCTDIDECSTNNGGCQQVCHNANGSYVCDCNEGYTLNSNGHTCNDVNECNKDTDECSDGCTNTVGSYLCYCNTGYELGLDDKTCVDTDECQINNGGCDSDNGECVNTEGSYYCTCNSGYQLKTDKQSCEDVNECSSPDSCDHQCINNIGSYTCDCPTGEELDTDGQTCIDINECKISNGGCDHICINTNGSYYCDCNDGFTLDADNHGCSDHNECSEDTDGCSQVCHNSHSSYYCSCNLGYLLDTDGETCNDINECTKHISGCTQICSNTVGSYTCTCYTGYTLDSDGKSCNDVNECYNNNGGCGQSCRNTDGSFECYCKLGYELNGNQKSCDDIDECSLNTDHCEHSCVNAIGSYTCTCDAGYKLDSDGLHCLDVNECNSNNGGCEDKCINTAGSYNCECGDTAYELDNDDHSCIDVDECDDHNGGCEDTCVNTDGSYYCECDNGYSLDIDNEGCSPVCADACNHCSMCVSPGLCTCETGWTGDDCCTDKNECNTLNGGCGGYCTNAPGTFVCSCSDGFTLGSDKKICKDEDECSEGTDKCNQVCTNTVGSYKCSCNTGYELGLDKKTCIDSDECGVGNGGCEHDCANTVGSYTCSCNEGYSLNSDNHNCDDINECSLDTDGCSNTCYNNDGSYTCDCPNGYELQTDGLTCNDTNECSVSNGKCDQQCVNDQGSYHCECLVGYVLDDDNHNCIDHFECDSPSDHNCEQNCHNTKTSYYCTCDEGYILDLDGFSCDDVNECTEYISGCNQVCTNSEGSYQCSCYTGYLLKSDHKTCQDIDECNTDNGGCTHTCTNTGGSFKCSCKEGYELDDDQHQCNDIHECDLAIDNCEQTCNNSLGSYTCDCKSGFELGLDGIHCSDIRECEGNNGGCDHDCTNTIGSYYCSCDPGYVLNGSKVCDDVEECLESNGGCDQTCTNKDGSYACSCNANYTLDLDDKGCSPICPDECGHCSECSKPYLCTCLEGWSGDDCCVDVDECDPKNGGYRCEQLCTNAKGTFLCSCYDGYTLNQDKFSCDDIDECSSNETNDCNHICSNTDGSYLCSCEEGYELGIDYSTCIDTNECGINEGGCSQTCVNEIGSYHCECNKGYTLSSDKHSCDDINECADGIHNCSHYCYNNVGGYTCDCEVGFELDKDLLTCIDVDECADGNNGFCDQFCNNTNGSYHCECDVIGYILDEDERGCSDKIECVTSDNDCDQHCHNSHGSYYCTCNFGYILQTDGRTCTDINECKEHLAGCNQLCINTDGSYICDCFIGFELRENNRTCHDIDECLFDNGGCNQTCTNTTGSYKCSCDQGYKLNYDQHGCDDIDECALGTDLCEHTCFNSIGSYYCQCHVGYYLEENGFNCTDINECDSNNGGCNQTCINEIGSFYCECDDGFLLAEDEHNCTDVNECNSSNGNCQHNCHNHYGTYSCSCFDGYDLLEDFHSCYGQVCNKTLVAPINGSIICTGEQITNESCSFYCDPGFEIHNSVSRTCQADHTWTGDEPFCVIKSCETLKRPLNAYIISVPCFTEFTSKCEVDCVEGYYVKDEESVDKSYIYQECRADPHTNAMYWSDPPDCIYKPPCTSNPCLNNGVCRDLNNYEFRCNCRGTHYKGLQCEIGVIHITQIPILTVGQTVTMTVEAYPQSELFLSFFLDSRAISVNPSAVLFTRESTTASMSVMANTPGIHFLQMNISGKDSLLFERPKPMVVITRNNTNSSHTHFQYFDKSERPLSNFSQGCCEKEMNSFSCPDELNSPAIISSCSWGGANAEETLGVVFVKNEGLLLPMGVAGVQVNDGHPLLTLPSSSLSCTACSTQCKSYNFTHEDVIDFIKSHALGRSFLSYSKDHLLSWITLKLNAIDSWYNDDFSSFDIIVDVVHGEDIILIDGCEDLDVPNSGLYAVLRYNDSIKYSVDGVDYFYLPQRGGDPVCFAVNLCDGEISPLYITIPKGHQQDLEQLALLQAYTELGWIMNIFEVGISVTGVNATEIEDIALPTVYFNANSNIPVHSILPLFNVWFELSIEKEFKNKNVFLHFKSDGILYFPEKINMIQGMLVGDTTLMFNCIINDQVADLAIQQFPGVPVPFVFPEYSTENMAWNGASFKFNYAPSELDTFFSSFLPSTSEYCPADMFLTLNDYHHIDNMIISTSCPGLYILGLRFPSWILEHRITITEQKITIESNLINDIFPVNEFLIIRQPELGYAVSVSFYMNGSINGVIKDAIFSIFGSVFSTSLSVSDSLTFSTHQMKNIYKKFVDTEVLGTINKDSPDDDLSLTVSTKFIDSSFLNVLTVYVQKYLEKQVNFFNDRLEFLQTSRTATESIFFSYSDKLDAQNSSLTAYVNMVHDVEQEMEKIAELVEQYQGDFDTLVSQNITSAVNVLSICEPKNCSNECAITRTCGLCGTSVPISEWGIGNTTELENVTVNYKKILEELEWSVDYLCRLTTNIKSWGVTRYGQICSYKSAYSLKTERKWVSEVNECSVSHHRSVVIDSYSAPVTKTCLSENACGLYLPSSRCFITNTACQIAQLNAIISLDDEQLKGFKKLLQSRTNLTLASTKAAKYRYETSIAECKYQVYKQVLLSLHDLISTASLHYDNLLEDFSYIQEIKSFLVNNSVEELFQVQTVSFEATVNNYSPSSVLISTSFRIPAFNVSIEIPVLVDFSAPDSVIRRDIATTVFKQIGEQIKGSRRKRECDRIQPSLNEQRFEQYCAMIDSVKDYLLELNKTFEIVTTVANKSLQQFSSLYNYSLVDIDSSTVDVNLEVAESFFNYKITKDMLLNLSFSSPEYLELVSTLEEVKLVSQNVTKLTDTELAISWWIAMNKIHNTPYVMAVGNRKCYGFADCVKICIQILLEVIEDSGGGDIPVVNMTQLQHAEQMVSKVITDIPISSIWELLEPLYNITSEIESGTNWCSTAPTLLEHPEPVLYKEMGSDVDIECGNDKTVYYQWFKDGFPIQENNLNILRLYDVKKSDEGQYQCSVSNIAGTTMSSFSELFVYIPPIIVLSPSNITTFEGSEDDALFVCNTTGYPTPEYTWYFSVDKVTWKIVNDSSNEYVVYKPTKEEEGWYKCRASIYDQEEFSEAAFLTVIGASISMISYPVEFNMAIYTVDEVHPLTDSYTQGLHETINNAVKRNEIWRYGFIENLITIIEETSQLHVSFHLSAHYDYSLTMPIADQALEANIYNLELVNILGNLQFRLREASISFEYGGDFFYAFPQSFNIAPEVFVCPDGQRLLDNEFICVNCSARYHSTVIDDIPSCVPCERGTYNGLVGQGQCTPCPEHMSTLETGLLTGETCKDQCRPHFNSSTGLEECGMCPEGYYQLEYGSVSCLICSSENKSNESLSQCYVQPPEPVQILDTRNLKRLMTYVALVGTFTILTVLVILIGSVVIFAYKLNAKRVKDHLRTRKELNDTKRKTVLPDFGPHGERLTTNPLFHEEEESSLYDRVGTNPMYFEIEEFDKDDKPENDDAQFPLTTQWEKERGSKIKQAKALFENNSVYDNVRSNPLYFDDDDDVSMDYERDKGYDLSKEDSGSDSIPQPCSMTLK